MRGIFLAIGVLYSLTPAVMAAQGSSDSNDILNAKQEAPAQKQISGTGKVHGLSPAHPATNNTFYIGRVYHEASEPYEGHHSSDDYTLYKNFRGLRAAFQHEHTRHIATLHAIETAKLDTMTVENKDSNDMVYNLNLPEQVRYLGLKSSVIASTNLQKGWQFYAGTGVFFDTYLKDSGNTENYGLRYDFGLGHSWYHLQAMLRFSGDLTNSQSNSDAQSAEVVMDLGYNF
ncbi:MAG: hypothetical protein ACJA1U_000829 [Bermanella sp.]|jgi:hypothetical protein